MQLRGLSKLTLLDYPGHLACTVFTGGCSFRCPFCHNAPLVLPPDRIAEIISEEDFFSFLKSRKGKLEGVCVTGGEPTLQPGLLEFLEKIKGLGFLVKLDTNGYQPDVLDSLLKQNLLDMVAMDIKNCKERYAETAGIGTQKTKKTANIGNTNNTGRTTDTGRIQNDMKFDITRIEKSIALLQSSRIPYEFRTTVVMELHTRDNLLAIGAWIAGDSPYFLQSFVHSGQLLGSDAEQFHAYPPETLREFAAMLKPYLPYASVRGIHTT